ncbi:branched-chain amino acid ABC transporter permease [bacterium]|nr:branched-chain amino acid ABC transporter permease [bacterium]
MLLQQIISGLANGFVYALLALGFAAVYRSMGLINFAQGDLFMAGAFVGLLLSSILSLSFFPLLLLTCLLCFCLGVVYEKLTLSPLRSSAPDINLMIRTIGLSVALQGVALSIWGTEEYRFPQLIPINTFVFKGVTVQIHLFYVGGAAVTLMALFGIFLKYTHLGLSMRAASQDSLGAQIVGVNVDTVRAFAFGTSSALGAASAVLISPIWYVTYNMGVMMGLKGFTAAVLGSFGDFKGAVIGGLFLGIVENLGAAYISSSWKDGIVFGLLVLVLALRPQGIFGRARKVRI